MWKPPLQLVFGLLLGSPGLGLKAPVLQFAPFTLGYSSMIFSRFGGNNEAGS